MARKSRRRSSCAARKLRRLQQDLSRKTKGSNRRKKAVVKVARAHARVADTRRDWQHTLSTAIIRDNQAVYVEDLMYRRSRPDPAGGVGTRCRLGAVRRHSRGIRMLWDKAAPDGRNLARDD